MAGYRSDVPGTAGACPYPGPMNERAVPPAVAASSPPRVTMVVEQMWQPVPGGSGTYVVELSRALRRQGVRAVGLAARHGRGAPDAADVGLAPLAVRQATLPRALLYESWNHLPGPLAEAVVPGADVVHATTWAVPRTRLPLVVTVHDLAFRRAPEHFTRRGARYFERSLARTVTEADAVIVPSEATAADCVEAGIPSTTIRVIPHGVRTHPVSQAEVAAFRNERGLSHPYVLWTGTREPRKNLSGLLRAYARLVPAHPEIDLVLVGPAGWGDDTEVLGLLADLPPERVHVLGRLPQQDLATAYAGARAFCFPSFWEGFGLPVLEAMAYGAPVVTSRATSMEEVVGDAGLLADPEDPGELSAALEAAVGPDHDTLATAGQERASQFTWEASATAHREVYAEVAR